MKKVLAILLATAMGLSLLVSCSPKTNTDGADSTSSTVAPNFDKQYDTDIVVVGGGGAGIPAAISAAQNGKKVILIEKVGYLGGATMMSGGLIPAVGTKQQVEAGIDDSIEWFVRDIMRPSNYSVREDLVHTVAEEAKPTIEWLEEMGVKFSIVTGSLYYGQSNYRMHLAEDKGKGLTAKMVEKLESMENITLMLNTPATALATDASGAVVGVYADNKDDGKIFISAENTILASSGFGANQDMIEKYIPEVKDAYPLVAPGATGDGILWGQALGADVAKLGSYQGHAFYSEKFGGSVDQSIMSRGGIFANIDGVRFTNEYGGYSELAPHVLAQPGNEAYIIFDDANAKATKNFDLYKEKDIVFSANTIEELATLTGINKEALVKTIAGYQESIIKGEDEFNRTKLPKSFTGPYHAIKVTADLRHTQGGLVTDIAGHVLTPDQKLIKGLYAAGGVTESFSSAGGAAYMSGNGLLQAVIFGKLAGETAAKETRENAKVATWTNPNDTGKTEDKKEETVDTTTLTYKDGEYEGEGKGHVGAIKVSVTVKGGKVSAVKVLSQGETEAIYASAEKPILEGVVANNGTSNVDVVAGATHSSQGLIDAVNNALSKAV